MAINEIEMSEINLVQEQEMPLTDDCPICLDDFKLQCKTNCGHLYCGDCILMHWRSTTYEHACICPLCRRKIYKLMLMQPLQFQQPQGDVVKVLEDINLYNRMNGSWSGIVLKVWRRLLSIDVATRLCIFCIMCLVFHAVFEYISKSISNELRLFFKLVLFVMDTLFVVFLGWSLWRCRRGQDEIQEEQHLHE